MPSTAKKNLSTNEKNILPATPIAQGVTKQSYTGSSEPKIPVGRLVVLMIIFSFIVGGISGALFSSTNVVDSITNALSGDISAQTSSDPVSLSSVSVLEESETVNVVKQTNESVVSIIVTKDLSKYYNSTNPFDSYFYSTVPEGQQEIGGGTGFIIGSDGLIVTNKHVVSDTDAEYTVVLNSGETYQATVVATDPLNDVAFVKIESENDLPTLVLGDSDALQIGQTVIAIGNALGEYRNTVTKGIVSGLSRTVTAGDGRGTEETLDDVIQTDAAINSGNSGGPLLNLQGQVVGVNTAISEEGQLIGFAIPVNQIKQAIESVQKNGRVVRPMLGVRYVTVTEDVAKQNDLDYTYGALVVKGSGVNEPAIVSGSPADRAGLQEDDIILEISGQKIEGDTTLSSLIQNFDPGDEVTITYAREKEEKTATVKLDELPAS